MKKREKYIILIQTLYLLADVKKKEEHKHKVDSAIHRYKSDGLKGNYNNIKYFSLCLQKVIILPEMRQIEDAFWSRLVTFNLTFAILTNRNEI